MRTLLGAPIPVELADEILRLVEDIRADRIGPQQSAHVVDVIARAFDTNMHYFFMRPANALSLGPMLRGVVEFGVNSSVKTIRFGLGKVIRKLNRSQLAQLAQFLDESLHEHGAAR